MNYRECVDLYELAVEEGDESLQKEIFKDLEAINAEIEQLYFSLLLSAANGFDNGCYVQVSAGSGGQEACDWALCLFEMYIAWSKRHKFEHKVLFKKEGKAAMEITGFCTYAWLKYEDGVHRRSRVSPFGQTAGQKRQTSFASVSVSKICEDDGFGGGDDIREQDLEWDVFRGSGPGGQHRNTTDSAVRCLHKPTGITVTVQDERNQHNAKIAAIRHLKFKLMQLHKQNEQKLKKEKYSTQSDSTFSAQIRNYIYTPYQLIKDNRTKCELKGNALWDALKNGNIDLMLKANIEHFHCLKERENNL